MEIFILVGKKERREGMKKIEVDQNVGMVVDEKTRDGVRYILRELLNHRAQLDPLFIFAKEEQKPVYEELDRAIDNVVISEANQLSKVRK